ncbi:hypothetical protein H257_05378 [Aphanomyces astaci]|uniref:SGNH hydrolase-type esterase domain-containing protein n=1 Tax=Aphanomyces astaci TaxID=112090 RepID=W4GR38_APHAT|nr:hypothetical protein H257_05378 [Aphanomyces astaci]ETV81806.1 hypothetical protein H257_05378 [Aphanomyces astaci]|eukprot:XP_009828543.1 hypothetical protein H257_05378 [Aphanomyces astaci]
MIQATRDTLVALSPRLVIVLLGTNDAAPAFYRSGGPQDEYFVSLRGILDVIATACPTAKLLLISPPVVVDEVFGLPQNEREGFGAAVEEPALKPAPITAKVAIAKQHKCAQYDTTVHRVTIPPRRTNGSNAENHVTWT